MEVGGTSWGVDVGVPPLAVALHLLVPNRNHILELAVVPLPTRPASRGPLAFPVGRAEAVAAVAEAVVAVPSTPAPAVAPFTEAPMAASSISEALRPSPRIVPKEAAAFRFERECTGSTSAEWALLPRLSMLAEPLRMQRCVSVQHSPQS